MELVLHTVVILHTALILLVYTKMELGLKTVVILHVIFLSHCIFIPSGILLVWYTSYLAWKVLFQYTACYYQLQKGELTMHFLSEMCLTVMHDTYWDLATMLSASASSCK
jgi:hypothetical protein